MKKAVVIILSLVLLLPESALAKKKHGMGSSFDDIVPGESVEEHTAGIEVIQGYGDPEREKTAREAPVAPPPAKKQVPPKNKVEIPPADDLPPYFDKSPNRPSWVDGPNTIGLFNGQPAASGHGFCADITNYILRSECARSMALRDSLVTGNGVRVTVTLDNSGPERTITAQADISANSTILSAKFWMDPQNGDIYCQVFSALATIPDNLLQIERGLTPKNSPARQKSARNLSVQVPPKAPAWLKETAFYSQGDMYHAIGMAKKAGKNIRKESALLDAWLNICLGYARQIYPGDSQLLATYTITYSCTLKGGRVLESFLAKDGNYYVHLLQPTKKFLPFP